jgi:hypothetical protein
MSIWKIVESKYIADFSGFQQHLNIRHSFVMPRNLVVYEFWDEVYEICFSRDPEVRKLAGADAETRKKIQQATKIEQGLIPSLYNYLNIFAFSVGARAFQYLCAKDDNFSSKVKSLDEVLYANGRLDIQLDGVKSPECIYEIVSEWNAWAVNAGSFSRVAVSSQDGNGLRIVVNNIENEEHMAASIFVEFGRMVKAGSLKRICIPALR